jgi:serine/threonine protein kinase/class 3 adenylate cyclase
MLQAVQALGAMSETDARQQPRAGLRHVTILFSDIAGFSDLTRRLGDLEAARVANRLLTLQEIIITRDALGQVLQFGGDSAFAVFDNASVALNRALEIQRVLSTVRADGPENPRPKVRIGLHMGEVLVREGERLEIISRHVNRAHRIMEAAAPGQILASDVVVDAARDFLDIPREHQAIRHYGEFYLRGVGATGLCEVADLRFRQPEPPRVPGAAETTLLSRLELAGYRPKERLGEGSFGVVYRAEQADSGRQVAVKVLNPMLCDDQAARERFTQEVERTQQLALPGIVKIVERRLEHQPPFFALELVEGKPVDDALVGAAPERIARVFRTICTILEQAHAAGVVHCDLKPGNILVRADDSVVLMDFGISVLVGTTPAAQSSSTTLLGTPAFLAPEIVRGARRGPPADIYSLGVLLFKVLAGREPFTGETVHDIIQAHLNEDPPPPAAFNTQVADGLQRICLKALEKNPEERYPGARQMAEDLDRFLRGELVRTRPTVYDNLLFHRVQKHVEQIRDWTAHGLLNAEESHRLLSSYEGLQRRGLPAVMEGRLFRLWQTLVYVGGWAVINGALLWLIQHWDNLSRAGKLTLGAVPALTTFTLAAAMWRLERFRLFFVALIVAVLATPLFMGVWLHEFQIAAQVPAARLPFELFHDSADSTGFTNLQMLWTALVTLVVAGGVMAFTRTTAHSAQALIAFALFYTTLLLPRGLRPQADHEQWARIALEYFPLLLAVSAFGGLLIQREDRHYQAPPWIYSAAILLPAISFALALHGLEEWTRLSSESRLPLSFLLLACAGVVQVVIGLMARQRLRHRCRLATLTVIFVGLLAVLAGLGMAGWDDTWPKDWLHVPLLGKSVPFPHIVLPIAAVGITLAACRYQMLAFLMVGLAGLAFSIHVLGHLYFKELSTWPRLLMVLGAACFFTALYRELRRTRGNTIDDVVSQARL